MFRALWFCLSISSGVFLRPNNAANAMTELDPSPFLSHANLNAQKYTAKAYDTGLLAKIECL